HDYLETRARLREHGCDFTDIPEALALIEMLQALPFAWTWEQAGQTVDAIVAVLNGGIEVTDLVEFLERHRSLETLGFSGEQAAMVAAALDRAGATGDRREDVLEELVNLAGRTVDFTALEEKHAQLEKDVARLEATKADLTTRVQWLREEVIARRQDLS